MFTEHKRVGRVHVVKRKYKIKSKFRFTLFVALAIVLVMSLTSTIIGNNTADSLTKMTYSEIQIQSGDTLWNLAKEFGPKDQDTRKVVHEICKLNNISADTIYPGQIISIPAYI